MTSNDKTREKLVGSMRKTKAVTGTGTESAETETAAAAADETTVKTAAEPVAKAKTEAKNDGRIESTSQPARASVDSYQSGQRVWPD
jgi:hypothetical protein